MTHVVSVEVVEEEGAVHDIEVEHDHSFIVGGVVVHNSAICRALSGRVYRYDDPSGKRPPQHVACRSSIRSLLKGIDQPLKDQKIPRTIKNYGTWLSAQPAATQDGILGPTRGKLFRDGTMTLDDAISKDNKVLNLAQLRASLGLPAQ